MATISDSPHPVRRTRNRRGEGVRLRAEILTAATGLIAEMGDAQALSIRALCAAVGVSAPSIYRHFPDKAALLRAVVAAGFAQFDAALDAAGQDAVDPFDRLRRRCLGYLRFAESRPGTYRMLFSAASLGPGPLDLGQWAHPGAASLQALIDGVADCLHARGDERDATTVAVTLWSLLHGMADLRIGKPELAWPQSGAQLQDALRRYQLDAPARRAPRKGRPSPLS
jgi:AcrR family transcriptional regulator